MKDKLIEATGQVDKKGCSHLFVLCSRTDYPARGVKQIENTAQIQGTTVEALAGFAKMVENISSGKTLEQLKAWADRQVYIALGFAVAACAELQIDTCPMEGFSPEKFHEILALPDYIQPVVIMAVGYRDPSDATQPPARAKVRFSKDDLFEFR